MPMLLGFLAAVKWNGRNGAVQRLREAPPGTRNWGRTAPSCFVSRSKLGCSATGVLAANGTEQNRPEVRMRADDRRTGTAQGPGGFVSELHLKDGGYDNDDGNRYGLRVESSRCRIAMKGGVGQIDIGQHNDQQHEEYHAAEDQQSRCFYIPTAHTLLFARGGVTCQCLRWAIARSTRFILPGLNYF
jgi:hypothetical protein